MMSELTSERVLPIWRSAVDFVSSEDFNRVYYALAIIHRLLPHIGTEDVVVPEQGPGSRGVDRREGPGHRRGAGRAQLEGHLLDRSCLL